MGRKYDMEFQVPHGADRVWEVLPDVLAACFFEIRESSETDRTIEAKKRMKHVSTAMVSVGEGPAPSRAPIHKTWGEKLRVRVADRGQACSVWVESRLVFGLIDWGENEKNVRRLRNELVERLADRRDATSPADG